MKVKQCIIVTIALLFIVAITPSSRAEFVNPGSLTDPYNVTDDNTPFYVFDIYGAGTGANNGSSSLTSSYFGGVLQYSTNGTDWYTLTNGGVTDLPTGANGYELVYLQLVYNGTAYQATNLTFQGWEIGTMFYNGIFVTFANGGSAFISPQNNDNLSPYQQTPIPGAAWLLGTGLFGLIAIRRRKKT